MAKNIVIVGGSLAGLFAGIAFRRLGHNVRILERSPSLLKDQGAGIVAGSDTQRFFQEYDLTQTPLAVTSKLRQYLSKEGEVIHTEDRSQHMTSWDLLYHILRANYDRIETDYCRSPPSIQPNEGEVGEYCYGCTVSSISDLGPDKGVSISFTDAEGAKHELQADLLLAADGASSSIRSMLEPEVERKYAGYVAWRGTLPESRLQSREKEAFVEKFTFFHSPGCQILTYLIPGPGGSIKPGERKVNWVWYWNYAADSQEHKDLMTDTKGHRHFVTLPGGGVQPRIWENQKRTAEAVLPPQFAEIVKETDTPFIQAITDVISPEAQFWDGRVLLVGDALAGFRPHTAASTSQAAYDAFMVAELADGRIELAEWEEQVQEYAKNTQRSGVMMGDRSQFGTHPYQQYPNP